MVLSFPLEEEKEEEEEEEEEERNCGRRKQRDREIGE